MARIPYLDQSDLAPENRDLLARNINLYRAFTHSPDATRSPVRICGNAAGKRNFHNVTAVEAPYRRNKSRSVGSVERMPLRVLAITGKMDTTNAEAITVCIP